MIKDLATFGGSDPLPVILGDAESGWSGAFGRDLLKWDSKGNLAVTPITWPNYQPRETGFQGYADGRFLLGSAQPGGCILAGEADDEGVIDLASVDSSAGGFESRFAGYTRVGNGMFAGLTVDPVVMSPPRQECIYDLMLREPGKPWYCTRISYPSQYPLNHEDPKKSNVALSSRIVTCALQANGRIGLYTEADSSGKWAYTELAISPDAQGRGTIVKVSHDENWIDRDQENPDNPLSPCAELAQGTTVEDKLNGRTLLGYQQYKDKLIAPRSFYSRWTIVEHRPGQRPRSIGMTEGYCLHKWQQKVIMVPMANNAVYVGLPFYNTTNGASEGWRFAVLENGVFHWTKDSLPTGDVQAHSHDGGVCFFDRTGGYIKRLIQVIPP